MYYLSIFLFVVGLVVLVIGYRSNKRNLLLLAAILLFLCGTLGDFVQGFHEGFNTSESSSVSSQ